jgi:hypothetical protein
MPPLSPREFWTGPAVLLTLGWLIFLGGLLTYAHVSGIILSIATIPPVWRTLLLASERAFRGRATTLVQSFELLVLSLEHILLIVGLGLISTVVTFYMVMLTMTPNHMPPAIYDPSPAPNRLPHWLDFMFTTAVLSAVLFLFLVVYGLWGYRHRRWQRDLEHE